MFKSLSVSLKAFGVGQDFVWIILSQRNHDGMHEYPSDLAPTIMHRDYDDCTCKLFTLLMILQFQLLTYCVTFLSKLYQNDAKVGFQ